MFGLFKKQPKKLNHQFAQTIKTAFKSHICAFCHKNIAVQLSFGQGIQSPNFTCKNCQMKAVGNNIKKLSEKNLISIQKLSNILTAQLMTYESSKNNPTKQQKVNSQKVQSLCKSINQNNFQITQQYQILREKIKYKTSCLIEQAQKQNTFPIFDQTIKNLSEKKNIGNQFMNNILKKTLVNVNGVHFIDQQSLDSFNQNINEKFTNIKKQSKVNIKKLKNLVTQINDIQL